MAMVRAAMVIGQLYLFRPEPVAERKFVGVHPARWAAAFQGIHAARSKRPLAQRRPLMKLRVFSCGLGHIPSSALAKARPCFSRDFDHLPCLSLAKTCQIRLS
jgi:hypothetical protein